MARSTELALEAEGARAPSVPPPAAEIGSIIRVAGRRVCTDPQIWAHPRRRQKGPTKNSTTTCWCRSTDSRAAARCASTTAVYAYRELNGWYASIRLTESMHDLIL